jgi:hypothetical protein
MRRMLTSAAGVLGAVLLGLLWLHFVHDPGVRRRARLAAQDQVADSLAGVFRDSLDALLERAAADSAERAQLQAEADSLRQVERPAAEHATDSILVGIPDTVVRQQLAAAVARERWIAAQAAWADSVRIARLEDELAARTRLLELARAAVDSLASQRDQWRKEAGRGRWGLGLSLGPALGPDGFDPVTLQVGVQYRLR